ncbi:MAG: hypothetical protein AVDCRST_MAG25-1332, partial [uncultured Rubrobacteraceae bacterium]
GRREPRGRPAGCLARPSVELSTRRSRLFSCGDARRRGGGPDHGCIQVPDLCPTPGGKNPVLRRRARRV